MLGKAIHVWWGVSLVALIAWTGVLTGCDDNGPNVENSEVVIGLLTPLTGDLGDWGREFQNAANLAIQEINAAGGMRSGAQFRLAVADTQTKADASRAAAQSLLDDDAVGVVGAAGSSNSLAAAEKTGPAQVPQISPSSTSINLNKVDTAGADSHPYFFRTTPSDNLQQVALGGLVAGQFNGGTVDVTCKRLAVINLDNDYGRPFGEGVAAQYRKIAPTFGEGVDQVKGVVVQEIDYPLDRATYVEQVGQLTNATPDCIVLISYGDTGGIIVREWYAENADNTVKWFVGDGNQSSSFFESMEAAHRDAFLGTAPAGDPNRPQLQDFDAQYRNSFGEDRATPFSPMVYDAAALLALAVIHADSTHGPQIRESLFVVSRFNEGDNNLGPTELGTARARLLAGEGLNYEGGAGPVDFDDAGDVIGGFEIWRWDTATSRISRLDNISASDLEDL